MKKFICFSLALIFVLAAFGFAFAYSGVYELEAENPESSDSLFHSMFGMDEDDMTTSEGLFGKTQSDTDIDQLGNKLKSKGLQVIQAIKTPCEVICIIAFILCCVLAAFGAFQRGPMLGKALIGALVAAVAYGAIVYAEDIVAMVVAFFAS